MPKMRNRLRALLTIHEVSVEISEQLRYRVEQHRTRMVARFEQEGHPDLMDVTFEEALTDALEVGLEYEEALEGRVADIVDGHLFTKDLSEKSEAKIARLLDDLYETGHCNVRSLGTNEVLILLMRAKRTAAVRFADGELRLTQP